MNPSPSSPGPPRSLTIAARLVIFSLVCLILYWGRVILVPVALAALISFILYPLVRFLQRLRLNRMTAVLVTMTLVSACLLALGWLVTTQLKGLAENLPVYRAEIVKKVKTVRDLARGGAIDDIKDTINEVDEQVSREEASEKEASDKKKSESTSPAVNPRTEPEDPVPVKIVPDSNIFGLDVTKSFSPVVDPLVTAGLALILSIFFLIKREDLSDRLVSFAGPAQLLVTIRALNEAGQRISRFLVTQFLINASYGLAVGVALYVVGVPYAIVWGLCATVFRYVPYVGPWVAAILPIAVSMITASGWTGPLVVIGVFLALELICNNVIEPIFYGKSVGISEVAVLISAVVWGWLWGPVGLVLATPLAVCMVVLGQHVPNLSFLTRLMVDRTELDPRTQLYHWLVNGDEENALLHVSSYMEDHSWRHTVDEVLLPTLAAAKRDHSLGRLKESEAKFIAEVVDDLIDQHCQVLPDGEGVNRHAIIICPPQGVLEAAALELAEHTLEDEHQDCDILNLSSNLLSSEVAERIAQTDPVAVVVASLPPDDITYARRWCRLVRRRCPEAYIIAARWQTEDRQSSAGTAVLTEAGANAVVYTTAELWSDIAPRLRLKRAGGAETEASSPTLETSSNPL